MLTALFLWLCVAPLTAQPVDISNPVGGITVRTTAVAKLIVKASRQVGDAQQGDFTISRAEGRLRVLVMPPDGKRVDIEVELPYGVPFTALTRDGYVRLQGLIFRGEVSTETGSLEFAAPWRATRLQIFTATEPPNVTIPPKTRFGRGPSIHKNEKVWQLKDRLDTEEITYGEIFVRGGAVPKIALSELPYPDDAPVKMPWLAPAVLDSILLGSKVSAATPGAPASHPQEQTRDGVAVFRSEVRVVALTVAVTDDKGAPITGLQPGDFEVLEDGVPQKVTAAGAEEVPFNLAIYLDLSGSTRENRQAMVEAARNFIGVARPQDKVAVYALANDQFWVVSRLTQDKAALPNSLQFIPKVGGGSPVYDTMVLAYAEELRQKPSERNAIIAITDGVDNQVYGTGTPSTVNFHKLQRAAEGMNALIYPIFLDPFDRAPAPGWAKRAREQMESLATRSGGKLFRARAIDDLSPVYPQVAEELRSVYSLSYSPQNQDFNGAWRKITVRVKKPGARSRTRPGYFAR
ncbi:MAG: VWA domain-containing protein [Bryobacterales bacterium]|nr:VWA domain-containing protein [Bryobacterales bacterium]